MGGRAVLGYQAAEMIRTSIRRIIPADRQSEEDDVPSVARRERGGSLETIRCERMAPWFPSRRDGVDPVGGWRIISRVKIMRIDPHAPGAARRVSTVGHRRIER
jgi:hypothetical protein